VFYGPEQAAIHDARFGDLARAAAALVLDRLRVAGHSTGTVVDLGCGSGIFSEALVAEGYDAVGVDIAPAMIDIARARVPGANFTVGSVHDVEIPDAVAIVALGEVLNYATDARAGFDALIRLAARVHAALAPNGVFVFDISTPGRGGPDGTRERFHDTDGWSLAMRSREHDGTLERVIAIFVRNDDGIYRRVDETHVLRLYDSEAAQNALEAIGFEVELRDGYDTPADFPGWKVFVCRQSVL
jgi:SAM-dependent methyltransferase